MRRRILGEEKGYNLIQVMMAAALLSVVALGVVRLVQGIGRQTNFFSAKVGSVGLVQEIRSVVSNAPLCTQAFEGVALNLNGTTELDIKMPGSSLRIKQGDFPAHNISVRRFYAEKPEAAGTTPRDNPLFKVNLMMESATYTPPKSAEVGRQFKAVRAATMMAELGEENKVIDCFTLESEMDLLRVACEQFGGEFSDDTKECDLAKGLCLKMGGLWSEDRCRLAPNLTEPCKVGPQGVIEVPGSGSSGGAQCQVFAGGNLGAGIYPKLTDGPMPQTLQRSLPSGWSCGGSEIPACGQITPVYTCIAGTWFQTGVVSGGRCPPEPSE